MTDVSEAEGWARGLDEVMARLAPRFGRVEPRRRALAYLRGLLAPVGRKNGWQLAEAAGDRTPDGMQDFLSRMRTATSRLNATEGVGYALTLTNVEDFAPDPDKGGIRADYLVRAIPENELRR